MRLGASIPNFKANTSKGPIEFYSWLGDSWCVLFSTDFTSVCTAELSKIAHYHPDFTKRNVKLLAHSIDSLKSHIDCGNDIKTYYLDISEDFPYPIVADTAMDVAKLLGMIDKTQKNDADTTTTALYIISPDKKVQLSMFYPSSTGRNVDEIIRCVDAIQLTERLKIIATPVNWRPGRQVMILPTVPDDDVRRIFPKGVNCAKMPSGQNYVRTAENY